MRTATIGLMLMCAVAHADGNVLVNGGFEQSPAEDGAIPGWTANAALAQQQLTLDDDAHSGDRAVCILSTEATEAPSVLSQRVPIEPGRDYQLTLWAKRDSFVYGTDFAVILLSGTDAVGQQTKSFRSNNTWRPITMGFNAGEADWAVIPTIVRRGAAVGSNATIMCGVEIGENALIGAGAVVTKDVPPGHLAFGVPARCEPRKDRG